MLSCVQLLKAVSRAAVRRGWQGLAPCGVAVSPVGTETPRERGTHGTGLALRAQHNTVPEKGLDFGGSQQALKPVGLELLARGCGGQNPASRSHFPTEVLGLGRWERGAAWRLPPPRVTARFPWPRAIRAGEPSLHTHGVRHHHNINNERAAPSKIFAPAPRGWRERRMQRSCVSLIPSSCRGGEHRDAPCPPPCFEAGLAKTQREPPPPVLSPL